jgi:hypothetical protein
MAKIRWQEMLDTRRNPSKQQRKERKAIMSGTINVTIKMDEAAQKKLMSRLVLREIGGGHLNAMELLVLSLAKKKDGDVMDLTKEAGKLDKLLKGTS